MGNEREDQIPDSELSPHAVVEEYYSAERSRYKPNQNQVNNYFDYLQQTLGMNHEEAIKWIRNHGCPKKF